MATIGKETPAHIRQRLQRAETEIEAAMLNVFAQEQIVDRLRAAGHNTELAERMLGNFKALLTLRITARDRIKDLLQTLERLPSPGVWDG